MAGEKVNWDSIETWQKVVAAIIASGVKLDLKSVAKFYGTTYDTLENKLRKTKKMALELKDEVESGQRGEIMHTRSAPTTPRKAKSPWKEGSGGVAKGRVSKATPTKKRSIKYEPSSSSTASSFLGDFSDLNPSSFGSGTELGGGHHNPMLFDQMEFGEDDFGTRG